MIRVLGDRVLVALPPAEETQDQATGYTVQGLQQTESGLFVAKPTDAYDESRMTRGIVVQVGEKSRTVDLGDAKAALVAALESCDVDIERSLDALGPAPFEVAIGDCVLFPTSAGADLHIDGLTYVILRESEILAVVEPLKKAEAA